MLSDARKLRAKLLQFADEVRVPDDKLRKHLQAVRLDAIHELKKLLKKHQEASEAHKAENKMLAQSKASTMSGDDEEDSGSVNYNEVDEEMD